MAKDENPTINASEFTLNHFEKVPNSMANSAGLQVSDVSYQIEQTPILAEIDCQIIPGAVNCILGASGSGKTSFLRLIAGLDCPQTGRIALGDQVFFDAQQGICVPAHQRNIGMMFQNPCLFPHLNVEKNLTFALKKKQQNRLDWVAKMSERFGLRPYLKHYPHELSGGQQQRVALLRALATQPDLLLLDEAFSSLDPYLKRTIREEVLELVHQEHITTLMVTHDPIEASFMAEQIFIFDHGRMIQQGCPHDIRKAPCNSKIAEFFGAVNRFAFAEQAAISLPILADGVQITPQSPKTILQFHPEDVRIQPTHNGAFELIRASTVEYGGQRLCFRHHATGQQYIAYHKQDNCYNRLGERYQLSLPAESLLVFAE